MVPMISSVLKPAVTRLIEPVAGFALRIGLTPNIVTLIGAAGVLASAGYFYPREEFFIGTLFICFFALSDLFDGTMARISHKGASAWGGFLDSTIDRITDSAITIAILIPLIAADDKLAYLGLVTLVTGLLIPYIRAKAESFGIDCSVGIAERTERLVIILTAAGFEGLGVPYALAVGLWLLAILGVITVLQRIKVVRDGLKTS
jgi:CDP-diacylglycerol--glycerol-3-phosphate 3-phosphatidyltransferase